MAKTTASPPADKQSFDKHRRRFPRRLKPFQGVYYTEVGQRIPMVGLDVSGGGMSLLLQQPVPESKQDLTINAVIDDKPFAVVCRIRWSDCVKVKGVDYHRYGAKISSIADADWDRLIHWTLQHGGDVTEGAKLSSQQRNSLLTPETQRRIGEQLVERKRLDRFEAGKVPLIEYSFVKYTMRQAVPYMLLKIRSRCSDRTQHTNKEHFTQVLVACEGGQVTVVD